ncbi:MAG: hypothetical protein CML24_11585 [Rhizobiales bacterium]|nr:hypothetical protein [Hyphomicrobiales bacterium]|tara:strand:- start:19536 stop:19835 length:300 start_codon:yes stop_codon:yes gene_type:complete
MKYAWAVPGAKVVCVVTGPLPESDPIDPLWEPSVGKVYTISAVIDHPRWLSVMLEESPLDDWCYSARRFRPVIDRTQEQDVAIFAPLLTQKSIHVSEDA